MTLWYKLFISVNPSTMWIGHFHFSLPNGLGLLVLTNIKSRAFEHNQDFFVIKQILALNAYMVGGGAK